MLAGENDNLIARLDELLALLPEAIRDLELVAGRCLNALNPVIGADAGQSRHACDIAYSDSPTASSACCWSL